MCTRPQRMYDKENDRFVEFACRTCDACLATRMNDWVARGVAEAAVAGETLAVRLSYRNYPDGTKPDGAVTFVYSDVQKFFKKLRQAYKRHYGADGEIRYIVAGERGGKNDRVHYHVVIFSDRPISILGDYTEMDGTPLPGIAIEKDPGIIWTMWDHGHVFFKSRIKGGSDTLSNMPSPINSLLSKVRDMRVRRSLAFLQRPSSVLRRSHQLGTVGSNGGSTIGRNGLWSRLTSILSPLVSRAFGIRKESCGNTSCDASEK